jgi:hypothetical protein
MWGVCGCHVVPSRGATVAVVVVEVEVEVEVELVEVEEVVVVLEVLLFCLS